MNAVELVQKLIERGVRLRQEAGRLLVDAPRGTLTPDLQDAIRTHREELVAILREANGGHDQAARPIIPGGAGESPWPLSPAQERFWLLDRLDPGSGVYNLSGAFRLEGPLDVPALEAALDAFVERHDVLRARFPTRNGSPAMERMEERGPAVVGQSDLSHLPPGERDSELRELLETWAEEPLDLEEGALFRARIVTLGPDDHALFVLSHSVAWDGWSFDVLLQDLQALYPTFLPGSGTAPPPSLPVRYSDYAGWQRERQTSGGLDEDMGYWRRVLENAPEPVALPTDRPRPARTFQGARINFRFDGGLLGRLAVAGREEGATLYMVVLAAFTALLYRYTWQDDLLVLTPVRGRDRPELEGVVGTFANTLALRTRIKPGCTFRDHLAETRARVLEALDHQGAPIEALTGDLGSLESSELYRTVFTYQNAAGRPRSLGSASVRSIARDHRRSYSEISLWVREHADYIDGALDYRTDLFRPETIHRFLEHFENLLEGVAEDFGRALEDLPDGPAGQDEAPAEDAGPDLPDGATDRDRDRLAVVQGTRCVTYGELEGRALALARDLDAVGAGPGVPVAVLGRVDPEGIAALAGVAHVGAPVVPVAAELPQLRIRDLLERAGVRHVVVPGGTDLVLDGDAFTVLDLPEAAVAPVEGRLTWGVPDIVVLDGTATSRPRPCAVDRKTAERVARGVVERVGIGSEDRVLVGGSLARPGTLFEVLAVLSAGARLVCPSETPVENEWVLSDTLLDESVDVLFAGTELVRRLVDTDWEGDGTLRLVCTGSRPESGIRELLSGRTAGLWWLDGHPEAGVWSHIERLESAEAPSGAELLPGIQARLVDPVGRPTPPGLPGELTLRAAGVAWHSTGELVRRPEEQESGQSRVYGIRRVDPRVWSGGALVDPQEAVEALEAADEVREAHVGVRVAPGGEERLVGYVVEAPGRTLPMEAELRARLSDRLPGALVPHIFVAVADLPRDRDGRLDVAALPDPFPRRIAAPAGQEDLRTAEERLVADVWRELLGLEQVGPADNFFELGGHSLLLLRAVGLLEERCGRRVDPRLFFFQDLGGVAAALAEAAPRAIEAAP